MCFYTEMCSDLFRRHQCVVNNCARISNVKITEHTYAYRIQKLCYCNNNPGTKYAHFWAIARDFRSHQYNLKQPIAVSLYFKKINMYVLYVVSLLFHSGVIDKIYMKLKPYRLKVVGVLWNLCIHYFQPFHRPPPHLQYYAIRNHSSIRKWYYNKE